MEGDLNDVLSGCVLMMDVIFKKLIFLGFLPHFSHFRFAFCYFPPLFYFLFLPSLIFFLKQCLFDRLIWMFIFFHWLCHFKFTFVIPFPSI